MNNLVLNVMENCARADVFVSENSEIPTRSAVKKLFDGGFVTLNGKQIRASRALKAGDLIEIVLPDAVECSAKPEDIPIEIIYEDKYLAVVNKPQGMTVHLGNGNVDGTLVNALLYKLDSLSTINGVIRPGIVHRIDKDTSGLLVVAKNDKAHLSLARQIEEKTCRRAYIALLEGSLKDDKGTVTTYIGRDAADRVKMAVVSPDKGKIAITEYRVLKRYQGFTLCRFDLQTGRTHQIRVHAKYLSHPVVGDKVYGIKKQKFNLNGQLLHAFYLQFTHPETGERLSFTAPLPDYFMRTINKLNKL